MAVFRQFALGLILWVNQSTSIRWEEHLVAVILALKGVRKPHKKKEENQSINYNDG